VSVGATARLGATLKVNVVALAVLGPLLVYSTVPATGCPALTVAGKVSLASTSATIDPPMATVAALLAGFGSVVAALIAAVTLDVADAGWV